MRKQTLLGCFSQRRIQINIRAALVSSPTIEDLNQILLLFAPFHILYRPWFYLLGVLAASIITSLRAQQLFQVMAQLSRLRSSNYSQLQSQKKKSLTVNPTTSPLIPSKKLSMGSQYILLNMDSLLQKQKALIRQHEKSSIKNQSKEERSPNISYAECKLFKQAFGKVEFLNQMAEQPIKRKTSALKVQTLTKGSFNYQYIIGKGGFGKVWKVTCKKSNHDYALKQMLKALVLTRKSIDNVLNERQILSTINHPFIVNIHYAFQDRQTLYLIMDLMPGGDLRYHIGTRKSFTEIQAKFFIACIVLGLQYIHSQNIIHRDIKPQNLVLDAKGYIRLTDFGIAKVKRESNSTDTSGTPGYMAPEVICRQDHSYEADYFALGVIAYQLMLLRRPYPALSRVEVRQQMLARQAQIKPGETPAGWSSHAVDFVNKLIQRKPFMRLGHGGIKQIKEHPWLRQLNWKKLYNKQLESPFIPNMKKNHFDQDAQITLQDEKQLQLIQKNTVLLRKQQFQDIFKDYFYDQQKTKTQSTQPFASSFEDLSKPSSRPQSRVSRNSKQLVSQRKSQNGRGW